VGYRQPWGCGIAPRRESARLRIIQLVYRENCSPRKIPDESHCPLTTACLHRCIIPSIQRRCVCSMLSHRTAALNVNARLCAINHTLRLRSDTRAGRSRPKCLESATSPTSRGQMDEKSGREIARFRIGSNRKSQRAKVRTSFAIISRDRVCTRVYIPKSTEASCINCAVSGAPRANANQRFPFASSVGYPKRAHYAPLAPSELSASIGSGIHVFIE